MARERIMLEVCVDLDPVPGVFHTKESAAYAVKNILTNSIPHYNPTVSTTNKK